LITLRIENNVATLCKGDWYFGDGVTLDALGNIYVADIGSNAVVKETLSAGAYSPSTISGLNGVIGVGVDASGNVYAGSDEANTVWKIDIADPPSLSFASTSYGATSSDSPKAVTTANIGNAPLTFPTLASGNNPSIASNFSLNSSGASACPLVGSGSPAGTLAAGASCQFSITFAPTAVGSLSGSLQVTDDNLNAIAPDYVSQSIALSGTAVRATPTITWATPAAIPYGTALSTTQLNATASVAGTFTYSPAAAMVLQAGSQTLSVTFTPTDTTDYTTATSTVTLTVNQVKPTITWATPAAIPYGTALSTSQLNATASVAGTFTYSPTVGAVLNAGSQALSVTFTPTDTTDYTTATSTVTLTVTAVVPTLTFAPISTQPEGAAPFAVSATSASNGVVTYTVTSGPATIAVNMVTVTGLGTVVLTANQAATGNYVAATATTSFVVGLPFTLGTPTGSTAESVAPGAAASFSLILTPTETTFPDAITFSVTGLPTGAIATFSPATIAAGSAVTPVMLTIQTPSTTTAHNEQPSSGNPLATVALGLLLLPLLGLKSARERLRQLPRLPPVLLAVGLSLGAVLGISGCGGGGTPPAAQSVTDLTLTVQ
jgi:hypothetical protein